MLLRKSVIRSSLNLFNNRFFGSYYKTTSFFKQLENTPSLKQKQNIISAFRLQLPSQDQQHFDWLVNFVNNKMAVGITSKVVYKHYLNAYVSIHEKDKIQQQLAQGCLPSIVSQQTQQSQLSLVDIRVFLMYLGSLEGQGSQKSKAQKVLQVCRSVSVPQGQYLLKLIDRKLAVGASKLLSRSKAPTSNNQKQHT